jgi:hypothetical protein
MDIKYFLLLKNNYDKILQNIDYIIELNQDVKDVNNDFLFNCKNVKDMNLINIYNENRYNHIFFIERKKRILQLKYLCDQYINSLCKHDFVEDSIDISHDFTKTITYCKLCELSEDYCLSFTR